MFGAGSCGHDDCLDAVEGVGGCRVLVGSDEGVMFDREATLPDLLLDQMLTRDAVQRRPTSSMAEVIVVPRSIRSRFLRRLDMDTAECRSNPIHAGPRQPTAACSRSLGRCRLGRHRRSSQPCLVDQAVGGLGVPGGHALASRSKVKPASASSSSASTANSSGCRALSFHRARFRASEYWLSCLRRIGSLRRFCM
jgi:hypothetical protein